MGVGCWGGWGWLGVGLAGGGAGWRSCLVGCWVGFALAGGVLGLRWAWVGLRWAWVELRWAWVGVGLGWWNVVNTGQWTLQQSIDKVHWPLDTATIQ